MLQRILRYLTLSSVLSAGLLAGAEDWTQLKIGMSTDEAAEALGLPLIRTVANGFELWIYDNHAEAVFYGGPLVGWTTPSKKNSVGRVVDVWQRKAGEPKAPMFILPRSSAPKKRPEQRQDDGVYSLPFYRIRN
jgi:hypothetical protein